MTSAADFARFGTIFFTIEDGGIFFEVEDARVEITRDVSAMGRRTGSSLEVRVHIVVDLHGIAPGSGVVQKFKVEWRNPVSGEGTDTHARELSFSGWCCGYELYRPEITGTSSFGTTEASENTRLGRADQLMHCTFSVVTDDDNIGNFTLTE